jgi:methyl-accepting chemotaxis protein
MTAGVGGYALSRLMLVGQLTHDIYANNLVAIQHLGVAVGRYVVHSRAVTRMPTQSLKEVEETYERSKKHWSDVQNEIAQYRATLLSDNEKTIVQQLDAQLPQYLALGDQVYKAMQANKPQEAARISNNELRLLSGKIEENFNALMAENAQQADRADQTAAATVHHMIYTIAG